MLFAKLSFTKSFEDWIPQTLLPPSLSCYTLYTAIFILNSSTSMYMVSYSSKQIKVHFLSGRGEVSSKTLAKHKDSAHKVDQCSLYSNNGTLYHGKFI